MAGAGKKWVVGCGIGCGLMLLILGGVGTCGYLGVKKIKEQADAIEVSSSDLTKRFGEPSAFVPDPDGTISPDRMEVFLAVRDEMAPTRTEVSDMLTTLDGDSHWLAKARAGLKMVPAMIRFVGNSRVALFDQGMGGGEYSYIYALSYYVLLHKDPADGPGFVLAGDNRADDDHVRMNWGHDADDKDLRETRARRVRGFVNRLQVELLNNQVEAFRATLPTGADPASDPWGAQLLAEQQAMSIETLRFPWEEGLPDQLRASLEPYRERLAESYDPMTSIIEMGFVDRN